MTEATIQQATVDEVDEVMRDRRVTDRGLGGTVKTMKERLDEGDARMGNIETGLAANTVATNEVLEIVRMGKSFFKVVGWIGKGVKWVASLVTALGGIWYVFTHGTSK